MIFPNMSEIYSILTFILLIGIQGSHRLAEGRVVLLLSAEINTIVHITTYECFYFYRKDSQSGVAKSKLIYF